MKQQPIFLFLLLLLAATCSPPNAQAATVGPKDGYHLVHDFKNDWYVYDEDYKNYIPYIDERHFDVPAHVIFCNLEQNRGYKLLIKCEDADNFLFIEGALKQKLPVNNWLVLSIDSLYKAYGKRQIYLTIYGSEDISSKTVVIGNAFTADITTETTAGLDESFQIQPRKRLPYRSSLSFLSIIIFGVFTYLSVSYIRAFNGFYNLRGLFTMYSREQSLFAHQALGRTNVLFIVLISLLLSFLYLLVQSRGINLFGNRWFLQEGVTVGILLANYFRLCILFFISFVIKYFFLGLLGGLFNLSKVTDLHFFKLIQSSILFYSVLAVLLFSLTMNYITWDPGLKTALISLLSVFYMVRTVIIFLTINSTLPTQLLYLISYLCIVEVIPIVIGLRLLV